MKKIVFLGSKAVGYSCLKYLLEKQKSLNYKIVGVLTNKRGKLIKELCASNNLNIIKSLDDMLNIEDVDIGICVQYHQILRKIHIEKPKDVFVNLHMAPLPEYRGCNQFSFAIINKDKKFGTTIHRLEERIDAGDILFEKRFDISDNIWVSQLYEITLIKSVELFKASLAQIISLEFSLTPQHSLLDKRKTSYHYRKEIETIKKIDLSWSKERIMRHIRATYMPGFEPPYTFVNGMKLLFQFDGEESKDESPVC